MPKQHNIANGLVGLHYSHNLMQIRKIISLRKASWKSELGDLVFQI